MGAVDEAGTRKKLALRYTKLERRFSHPTVRACAKIRKRNLEGGKGKGATGMLVFRDLDRLKNAGGCFDLIHGDTIKFVEKTPTPKIQRPETFSANRRLQSKVRVRPHVDNPLPEGKKRMAHNLKYFAITLDTFFIAAKLHLSEPPGPTAMSITAQGTFFFFNLSGDQSAGLLRKRVFISVPGPSQETSSLSKLQGQQAIKPPNYRPSWTSGGMP